MNQQDVIWSIALGGIGLVALVFIYVIAQAGRPADEEARTRSARTSYSLQTRLFGALLVVFAAGSWATLRRLPIPPQHGDLESQQVVDVVGHQWNWTIEPATVRTGEVVEFRVTSADVNHGFALYAPDGHIVTQTQSMPGYTNRLLYTFTEPGSYVVQCLEFCGIGHAPMKSTLEVVAGE